MGRNKLGDLVGDTIQYSMDSELLDKSKNIVRNTNKKINSRMEVDVWNYNFFRIRFQISLVIENDCK